MATSQASGPGPAEVELSPAEAATLRRFVRRHALAGPAGAALVAAVLLALGLSLRSSRMEQRPASDGAGARVAALEADLAALRAGLATRVPAAPAAAPHAAELVALAQRIEAMAHEIRELRLRVEVAPAPRPAAAAAPAGDAAGLAQRLWNVEARQTEAEATRTQVESQLLARLDAVESRQQQREEQDALALRGVLDRMGRLEGGRDAAERLRLEAQGAILARLEALESAGAIPAAPRP